MKQLNWILQSNLIKQEIIDNITEALKLDNISYEEVKVIPFSDELPVIRNLSAFNIFYGSTTLIMNAWKDRRFRKGVFYDEEKFNIGNYIKQWGGRMLNSDAKLTTLREFSGEDHYAASEWFIRPNEDDKAFSGTVMKFSEIRALTGNLAASNNPHLTIDTIISISTPKIIDKEWRHFIVNGKVISSSRYMRNGELDISTRDIPEKLIRFTEESCEQYPLHDIFVMDTALCNGNYFIIECNCFNGTGFYNHDVVKIIRAVNEHLRTTEYGE